MKRIPDPPKPCVVLKNGIPLTYSEKDHILFVANKGFTTFPSIRSAHAAINYSVEIEKADGIEKPWLAYEVIETQNQKDQQEN